MSQNKPKMISMASASLERLELERLHERVERLFLTLEDALESEGSSMLGLWSPKIDLFETAEAITVEVEVAGVEIENLSISLSAGELLIEGEKKHSARVEKIISHFCCERLYGAFRRSLSLRWTIDPAKAKAILKDGLLRIDLPKIKDRRGKSVAVSISQAN